MIGVRIARVRDDIAEEGQDGGDGVKEDDPGLRGNRQL
jgi:hypothetical protein